MSASCRPIRRRYSVSASAEAITFLNRSHIACSAEIGSPASICCGKRCWLSKKLLDEPLADFTAPVTWRKLDVKMAKPSAKDFDVVHDFLQRLESIVEQGLDIQEDSETEIDDADVGGWVDDNWRAVSGSWQRLLWAGKTAIDNLCDPDADALEVKPEIQSRVNIGDFVIGCVKNAADTRREIACGGFGEPLANMAKEHIAKFGVPKSDE
jgi:hypothetical protein